MLNDHHSKSYLIIGGSSGIGKELVHILSEQGHRVYATYNKNYTEGSSDQVSYHSLNVLDDELNLDFVPDVLDGFVYCPGSIELLPIQRIKADRFIADIQLQVFGAIKVLQKVLKPLKKGQGSMVLFSTVAVQKGFPFHSQVAASKGAIEGLTRSLAAELAPLINVNTIAPSITDTPLAARLLDNEEKKIKNAENHPLKKIGKASDIAAVAAFLLSSKTKWMTGQIIHVDGGKTSINL